MRSARSLSALDSSRAMDWRRTSQGSSSEPSIEAKTLSWSPVSLSGPSARAASSHASMTTGAASRGRARPLLALLSFLASPFRLAILGYSEIWLSVELVVLWPVVFGSIKTGESCGAAAGSFAGFGDSGRVERSIKKG